ncbi:hypothetical protein TNCT_197211 [Trichonephila clavata]|uniref:Uncharacterized protein n=1 Tax=Trichonephila clavata TaxID=2740835 RepID=A0A8X6KG52_TRICU|nr:hypothetical protein TNCT_197211 [Trichonephila clavata]
MGRVDMFRMNPERTALKIFNATPSNKRPNGRLTKRLKDYLNEDFVFIKVKKWISNAGISEEWEKSEEGTKGWHASSAYDELIE